MWPGPSDSTLRSASGPFIDRQGTRPHSAVCPRPLSPRRSSLAQQPPVASFDQLAEPIQLLSPASEPPVDDARSLLDSASADESSQPIVVVLPLLRSTPHRITPPLPIKHLAMEQLSHPNFSASPSTTASQTLPPPPSAAAPPPPTAPDPQQASTSATSLDASAPLPSDGSQQPPAKKQAAKMFRCNGFGDCQMTFTRSVVSQVRPLLAPPRNPLPTR
ncbi:hypothetical protein JCM5296_000691 [Sporobolomyces johnsonii]